MKQWPMRPTLVAKLQPGPMPLDRETTAIQGLKLLSGRLMSEHASAGSAAYMIISTAVSACTLA